MYRNLAISLVLALSSGCLGTDGDGGQFGQEVGAHCETSNTTVLAIDEASALGFSGQSLLDAAGSTHDETMTWSDDSSTDLTLTVTHDGGEVRYIEQVMVDDSGGGGTEPAIEPALDCPPYVEVDVAFTLQTADGQLDESWDGALTGYVEGSAQVHLDLQTPSGTFDGWDHVTDTTNVDEVKAWADIEFAAGAASGTIAVQASGVIGDPEDPESVAFAENITAGSFGGDDSQE